MQKMTTIQLKCGIRISPGDVSLIFSATIHDVEWQEEFIPQHGDIQNVEQFKMFPCKIAGVMSVNEPIVFGVRTLVTRVEDTGKILFHVESSADYIQGGRFTYSYGERNTIISDSLIEMKTLILAEYKRFLQINMQ